jgi:hypothetical protein
MTSFASEVRCHRRALCGWLKNAVLHSRLYIDATTGRVCTWTPTIRVTHAVRVGPASRAGSTRARGPHPVTRIRMTESQSHPGLPAPASRCVPACHGPSWRTSAAASSCMLSSLHQGRMQQPVLQRLPPISRARTTAMPAGPAAASSCVDYLRPSTRRASPSGRRRAPQRCGQPSRRTSSSTSGTIIPGSRRPRRTEVALPGPAPVSGPRSPSSRGRGAYSHAE